MKRNILPFLTILFTASSICSAQGPYLVGTTLMGGNYTDGDIFKLDASGHSLFESHDFGQSPDGSMPWGAPIRANNGLFYGMTKFGGAYGAGVIFGYNAAADSEFVLYNFATSNDGDAPYGSFIQARNGLLYGMTSNGGANTMGGIISFDIATDSEKVLYSFAGGSTDAGYPYGSLAQAGNGLLYGISYQGGANSYGVIFSFNISTDSEIVLYNFGINDSDATEAFGSLIQANDSLLYGMTSSGGSYDEGTIFSFNITTGKDSVLHSFAGYPTDGGAPQGSLLQANNGLLYGMTGGGGAIGNGEVFSYNITTGKVTDIYDFKAGTDGRHPDGSLMQASDGKLYGMTTQGGVNNDGMTFSFNITDSTYADVYDFTGFNGWQPEYGALVEYTVGLPVVAFSGNPLNNCDSLTATFTDASTNGPTAWNWTFSGGTPASATGRYPAPVKWSAPGSYTVTLIASNANGNDTLSKTGYINVYPSPGLSVATVPASSATAANGSATVSPKGGTAPFYYRWSNSDSTAMDTGLIHGTYFVTLTDAPGCTATDSAVVAFNTGIIQINDNNYIKIYPDPATEVLNVNWAVATNAEVFIVDLAGKTVKTFTVSGTPANTFDIHDLAAGEYIINILNATSGRAGSWRFTKL